MFVIDMDSNFLLACDTGGRMPKHLKIEFRFSKDTSSIGDGSSTRQHHEEDGVGF